MIKYNTNSNKNIGKLDHNNLCFSNLRHRVTIYSINRIYKLYYYSFIIVLLFYCEQQQFFHGTPSCVPLEHIVVDS